MLWQLSWLYLEGHLNPTMQPHLLRTHSALSAVHDCIAGLARAYFASSVMPIASAGSSDTQQPVCLRCQAMLCNKLYWLVGL